MSNESNELSGEFNEILDVVEVDTVTTERQFYVQDDEPDTPAQPLPAPDPANPEVPVDGSVPVEPATPDVPVPSDTPAYDDTVNNQGDPNADVVVDPVDPADVPLVDPNTGLPVQDPNVGAQPDDGIVVEPDPTDPNTAQVPGAVVNDTDAPVDVPAPVDNEAAPGVPAQPPADQPVDVPGVPTPVVVPAEDPTASDNKNQDPSAPIVVAPVQPGQPDQGAVDQHEDPSEDQPAAPVPTGDVQDDGVDDEDDFVPAQDTPVNDTDA